MEGVLNPYAVGEEFGHRAPREIWRRIWSNNPQERLNR
ncbi:transposase [Streptomyces sp. NBC_01190]|nr:transposase [Streptomyces sp. NBC_01190]